MKALVEALVGDLVLSLVISLGSESTGPVWQLLKQADGNPIKQADGSDIFVRTH